MPDFSLKVVFGMDASGVKTEIKQLRKEMNDAVDTWGKIGIGAAVGAFVALAKGAGDLASGLKKTSLEIGIGVDKLQVLDSLAMRNNESQETLRKALEKTRLTTQEAATGNDKMAAAYRVLGVNINEIVRLPLEQKISAIARGLVHAENQQAAYNAVAEIFGAKVGPQLINSLTELGTEGFDKAAKAAADAGHIMSAETIVALEKAQSVVEEFKKRATIAVGEIIVNFRSEEGLKLLLFQFLKIVGTFGAGIVDAVVEAGEMVWAVFKGAFKGVLNFYRDGFLDIIALVAEQFNKIMPQWLKDRGFKIDVTGIDALKSAGTSVADEITNAIAATKPSTFKKEVADYWDGAIKDQQAVVDKLNKVDFGKEATKLKDAGTHMEGALKTGAEGVVVAAVKIVEAAKMLSGVINRTGQSYADQSSTSLQGVYERIKRQLQQSEFDDSQRGAMVGGNGPSFATEAYRSELYNIEKELKERRDFADDYRRLGAEGALRKYGDTDFQRFTREMQTTNERQTNAIESIQRGLGKIGLAQ